MPWASMWPLEAPQAIGINTDPGHGRTKDPDMFPGSGLDPYVMMALVGFTDYPDYHGQVAGWPSNANMYPGGNPDPRHLFGLPR